MGRRQRVLLAFLFFLFPSMAGAEEAGGYTRIISLYSAHTENLLEMGAKDRLVGVSRSDAEKLPHLPLFSYHDGTERFLAAQPDLVLVRPMIERGYPGLLQSLRRHGIQVVSLQPKTMQEMLAYWRELGRLSGKKAAAGAMVTRFLAEAAAIRSVTKGISPKKQVFFEAMHPKLRTFSPGSLPVFVLKSAGGIPVADDALPSRGSNIARYGKERLLAKGETIDVYLAQRGRMNRVTREEILSEPGFSLIRAVREKEIYFVEEALVARPTPALISGMRKIAGILYPGQFPQYRQDMAGK